MRYGDAFAALAQPVARGIDYVAGTNIRNCQSCKDRQQRWNEFNIFDLFWSNQTIKGDKMQKEYAVQLVIKADDLTGLISKLPKDADVLMIQLRMARPVQPPTQPPPAPQHGTFGVRSQPQQT